MNNEDNDNNNINSLQCGSPSGLGGVKLQQKDFINRLQYAGLRSTDGTGTEDSNDVNMTSQPYLCGENDFMASSL
ncbi:hypothetical protein ACOMHN_051509 [Nucella lapillus]